MKLPAFRRHLVHQGEMHRRGESPPSMCLLDLG